MDSIIGQLEYVFAHRCPSNIFNDFFDIVMLYDLSHILVYDVNDLPRRQGWRKCCLRVRQDYYIAHQSDKYYNRWVRVKPQLTDPYIYKMYLEDMAEKRMIVMLGFYTKGSGLSNLNELMILNHILQLAGLYTH